MRNYIATHSRLFTAISVLFFVTFFTLISVWKYYNFAYNAMDLAIIHQAFYTTAHGNWLASSIHPPTYAADHFTPIIFLLQFIYFFIQHPLTLLVLQMIVLGACAWPIYLLAKKKINELWAVFFVGAWLLNPLVANIAVFEFHLLPFAIFLIFWVIYFFDEKKFFLFILFSGLALLVREDVTFVIFFFSVLAIIEKRNWKWILVPGMLALFYGIGVHFLFTFLNPNGYKFLLYYGWLGENFFEGVRNILTNPLPLLIHIINYQTIEFVIGILLPFAFLPLLKPKYVVLTAGIVAQLALSNNGLSATLLFMHYTSLLLAPLMISMIEGAVQLRKKITLSSSLKTYQPLLRPFLIVTVIFSAIALGPYTAITQKYITSGITWPGTEAKRTLKDQIPSGAAIAATYEFLPTLSTRSNLYSLNYVFLGKQQYLREDYTLPPDTEFLLVDLTEFTTYRAQYGDHQLYQDTYQAAIKNWPTKIENFGLIEIHDSIALYQKNASNTVTLLEIHSRAPEIEHATMTQLSSVITFLGHTAQKNHYSFFWQISNREALDYYILITQKNSASKTVAIPLTYHALSPNVLKNFGNNTIVQTNYWPDRLDESLQIQVIAIKKAGLELDRLGITKKVFDNVTFIGDLITIP